MNQFALQILGITKTGRYMKLYNKKVIQYEMLLIVIKRFNKEEDTNPHYIKLESLINAFCKNVKLIPVHFGDIQRRQSLINNLEDLEENINESYKRYIKYRKKRIRSATI